MSYTLLGIFSDRWKAEQALTDLESSGFNPKDISIIMRDQPTSVEKTTSHNPNPVGVVTTGLATGTVLGGVAGLLIGVGAIAVPGIGAILVGGPLAVAFGLTGAAASTVSGAALGALAGGLVGALANLGVPEHEAKVYEHRIKEGGILLAVPVLDEGLEEARGIMQRYQADMIRTVLVPQEAKSLRKLKETQPVYKTEVVDDFDGDLDKITDYPQRERPSVENTLKSWGENLKNSVKDLTR